MSVYVCCLQKKGRISKNTFQYKKKTTSPPELDRKVKF